MTRENEYSDHQIEKTRTLQERKLGRPMTDEEQRRNFGRILPRKGDSGATNNSSRTIHVDEPSTVDTNRSGRHAKPGIVSRIFGRSKKS